MAFFLATPARQPRYESSQKWREFEASENKAKTIFVIPHAHILIRQVRAYGNKLVLLANAVTVITA
jgi:hypothetical protein